MKLSYFTRTLCAIFYLVAVPLRAEVLTIPGTGDGIDVFKALAAAFSTENPQTSVVIPPSIGSGGGIAAVGLGTAVMGRVARALSDSERGQGIRFEPVFNVPSAIFVNPAAQVTGLSFKQLRDVYTGDISNWQEVGGVDLKIKVVRRENEDSTFSALRANMPGWSDIVITARSKTDVTTQDAIQSVRDTPGAIGFGPYTNSLADGTIVLKIDGKYPAKPDYPSVVRVGLIFKDQASTPGTKAFLNFIHTEKAIAAILSMGAAPAGD